MGTEGTAVVKRKLGGRMAGAVSRGEARQSGFEVKLTTGSKSWQGVRGEWMRLAVASRNHSPSRHLTWRDQMWASHTLCRNRDRRILMGKGKLHVERTEPR